MKNKNLNYEYFFFILTINRSKNFQKIYITSGIFFKKIFNNSNSTYLSLNYFRVFLTIPMNEFIRSISLVGKIFYTDSKSEFSNIITSNSL